MTPNKAAFLSIVKPVRAVELPDGPTVHVRALTVAELGRFQERSRTLPDTPDRDVLTGAMLCTFALCEADGAPFFADPTEEDLAFVAGLTARQLDALAESAGELNRPDKDRAKN